MRADHKKTLVELIRGAIISALAILFLMSITGCGRKSRSGHNTPNPYIVCSEDAYHNSCTHLVAARSLHPYELYDRYCYAAYKMCLEGYNAR